jgi:hypothetical protein
VESRVAGEPVLPNAEPLAAPDATAELLVEGTEKPALLKAGAESRKESEPTVLELEILEVAEILVFRPSYKYWHNCIQRRHKHAHRENAKFQ